MKKMTPTSWSVLVEFAGPADAAPIPVDDRRFDELVDAVDQYAGSVGGGDRRYSVRLFVEADDALTAAMFGREAVWKQAVPIGLPEWPVVRLEAVTEAELDADLARPQVPELLGAAEVAERLGVSRQRVGQLRQDKADFPTPFVDLAAGPVWTAPAIDAWSATWDRSAGRPRRTTKVVNRTSAPRAARDAGRQ